MKPAERYWHQLAARATAMLGLVAFLDYGDVSPTTTLRILAVVFVAQAVLLAFLPDRIPRNSCARYNTVPPKLGCFWRPELRARREAPTVS